MRGHGHDWQPGLHSAQPPNSLQGRDAIHDGHVDIHDHHVMQRSQHRIDGFLTIGGDVHLAATTAQQFGKDQAIGLAVVRQQNAQTTLQQVVHRHHLRRLTLRLQTLSQVSQQQGHRQQMVDAMVSRRNHSHGERVLQGGHRYTGSTEFREERWRYTAGYTSEPQIDDDQIVGHANANLQGSRSLRCGGDALDVHSPSGVLAFNLVTQRALDQHQDAL